MCPEIFITVGHVLHIAKYSVYNRSVYKTYMFSECLCVQQRFLNGTQDSTRNLPALCRDRPSSTLQASPTSWKVQMYMHPHFAGGMPPQMMGMPGYMAQPMPVAYQDQGGQQRQVILASRSPHGALEQKTVSFLLRILMPLIPQVFGAANRNPPSDQMMPTLKPTPPQQAPPPPQQQSQQQTPPPPQPNQVLQPQPQLAQATTRRRWQRFVPEFKTVQRVKAPAEAKNQPSVQEMKYRSAAALEDYKANFMTPKQQAQLKAQQEWFARYGPDARKAQGDSAAPMPQPAPQAPKAQTVPRPQTASVPAPYQQPPNPATRQRAPMQQPDMSMYMSYNAPPPVADPGDEVVEVSMLDGSLVVMTRREAMRLASQTGSSLVSRDEMEPQPRTQMPMSGSAYPMQSIYATHDPHGIAQYPDSGYFDDLMAANGGTMMVPNMHQQDPVRDPYNFAGMASTLPQYESVQGHISPTNWEASGPYQPPPQGSDPYAPGTVFQDSQDPIQPFQVGYAPVQQPQMGGALPMMQQAQRGGSAMPMAPRSGSAIPMTQPQSLYSSYDPSYMPQYRSQARQPIQLPYSQPQQPVQQSYMRAGSATPMQAPLGAGAMPMQAQWMSEGVSM